MSFEFLAGVALSTFFFILSTAVSLFAPDFRHKVGNWLGLRRLLGATKQMQTIERRIGKIRRLAKNPELMAAHFWTELFLQILLLGQLIFLLGLTSRSTGWFLVMYLVASTALWVWVLREATQALRLAAELKDPEMSVFSLERELTVLEQKFGR